MMVAKARTGPGLGPHGLTTFDLLSSNVTKGVLLVLGLEKGVEGVEEKDAVEDLEYADPDGEVAGDEEEALNAVGHDEDELHHLDGRDVSLPPEVGLDFGPH